ncbi:MAG: deoxyguanosinetriphosphate triphosphohydrolase [Verrucomicrobiia bacterium]
MPVTRQQLEEREHLILAPYAQFSDQTRGRNYPEDPPEMRTHFQRDRDRVIHSRAFRRLEYKTQVFLNGTGDHLRTRLTHTMEVAAISRNIARALQLNEDLAETIALAHDLGHSPFGHNGEKVLNKLMKNHGGFEHNVQSLRIVEVLEQKYPNFPGLNLTWEVREGLIKHNSAYDKPLIKLDKYHRFPSLEAQVANLADEVAYYSHDLDDGLETGLLNEAKLKKEVQIWCDAHRFVQKHYGKLPDECRRYFIIRCIIDQEVNDIVKTTEKLIADSGVKTADDVRRYKKPLVQYSENLSKLNLQLRKYLYKNLYFNPEVHEPNRRAVRMLEQLFKYYLEHPDELSEQFKKRAHKDGWHRAVCDYVSGMTDRFALAEHQRLFGIKLFF